MKKTAYKIGFGVSALLALLCLILCVVTLFTGTVEGIFVREPVSVSASLLDATRTQYGVQVRGLLFNEGGERVHVDALKLVVRHGNKSETRTLEGFDVEARSAKDLFYEWTSETAYDSVDAVELVIDGEGMRLSNAAPSFLSLDTLLFLTGCVIFAFLAVFFAKKTYYISCEEKLLAKKEG